MQRGMKKQFLRNSFFIAVILHLLFFLSMTTILTSPLTPEDVEKNEKHFVPSYVYTGAVAPPTPIASTVSTESTPLEKPQANAQTKSGFHNTKQYLSSPWGYKPSVTAMSQSSIRQASVNQIIKNLKQAEPMLLVGDSSQAADPLIKLIGRSLSTYFIYPKMEGSFAIKGRVVVEFILHPEGYYTDIQIVKSSDNRNFDAAALYAVNKAPKVIGADRLILKPKYLVVGFIFN